MSKVVYDEDYPFLVNDEIIADIARRKGVEADEIFPRLLARHDPDFVAAVEAAIESGRYHGTLRVENIGDAKRYWIEDSEWGETVHWEGREEDWIYI